MSGDGDDGYFQMPVPQHPGVASSLPVSIGFRHTQYLLIAYSPTRLLAACAKQRNAVAHL